MTSSTFDRLLAQDRNTLPKSTTNYYELEQGDLKYDGVKNINDAIDADVKDFQESTNWAIEESKRYHESKEKQIQKFVGLIPELGKLKEWDDNRKKAAAQFDQYYTRNYDDYTGEKIIDPKQEEYIQEDNKKSIEKTNVEAKQHSFVQANPNDFTKSEQISV